MSRKKSRNKPKGGGKSSTKSPRTRATPRFSLEDEARWMSSHRTTAYEAGKRLRHLPIQFVSAGHLEGTLEDHIRQPQPPNTTCSPPSLAQDTTDAMAHMAIRTPSPMRSEASSSADEVVFRGRGHDKPAWEGKTTPWQHRSKPNIGWLPAHKHSQSNPPARGHTNPRDAALDDYMQNVEAFNASTTGLGPATFANRVLALDADSPSDWESASDLEQEEEEEVEEGEEELRESPDYDILDGEWSSDMLRDFDELSTSSDVTHSVAQILSKRTRASGVHYLCVYEGAMTDDARWLPASLLSRACDTTLILAFEQQLQSLALSASSSSDGEQDENEEDYEIDMDDEDALDDETIARVLQKQEELGLGSDEILLHGADEYFGTYRSPDGPVRGIRRQQKKLQARSKGRRNDGFASAGALADALTMDPYDGFDIMDTERPSLKAKKKGRRGQLPPEIDDPELNEQLQKSWEADRAKKRLKKAEREELRRQGLLGRKGKSVDLKVRYKGGIEMEDVVEEIREFLLGDTQSLSLPPMEAHRRATIHQIAAFFDLSSRSRGNGQDRFTILSKTARTQVYDEDGFDQAVQRKSFRQRLRGSLHSRQHHGAQGGAGSRSGKHPRPKVGYHDGDTVGANAPELGPDNRGHALMMKMGWSKGMALGTLDNQGILHPIPHKIKATKAGLQ